MQNKRQFCLYQLQNFKKNFIFGPSLNNNKVSLGFLSQLVSKNGTQTVEGAGAGFVAVTKNGKYLLLLLVL